MRERSYPIRSRPGVLLDVLQGAGIASPDQNLPPSVRSKHGTNRNGKMIHYYMNYSNQEQAFSYPYGTGTELLSQTGVSKSQKITLKPWDLILIEEK